MIQFYGHWCLHCKHLGNGHLDDHRRCTQCLRDMLLNLGVDVGKPLNYEEEV